MIDRALAMQRVHPSAPFVSQKQLDGRWKRPIVVLRPYHSVMSSGGGAPVIHN